MTCSLKFSEESHIWRILWWQNRLLMSTRTHFMKFSHFLQIFRVAQRFGRWHDTGSENLTGHLGDVFFANDRSNKYDFVTLSTSYLGLRWGPNFRSKANFWILSVQFLLFWLIFFSVKSFWHLAIRKLETFIGKRIEIKISECDVNDYDEHDGHCLISLKKYNSLFSFFFLFRPW